VIFLNLRADHFWIGVRGSAAIAAMIVVEVATQFDVSDTAPAMCWRS
jgi:hypothetical protein